MSGYRKDNHAFLDLIDLIYEMLKDTKYKMYIHIREPLEEWDEENPHPDWIEYDKYDKNPEFKKHISDEGGGWGQSIKILDPETQAPYCGYGRTFRYNNPLIEIWQDYEHYDRYEIIRNAAYMYDVIHYGQTTNNKDYREKAITYKTVLNYVKNSLINDLAILSEATKKLAEIHANDSALAKLKYKKIDYDD